MVRYSWLLLVALGVLSGGLSATQAQDKKGEGKVVDFDGLKSQAPGSWKEEKPMSSMRFLQFRVPKAKDDKDDAELIIFKNLGGTAQQNVDRWKGMFLPPEGKKMDEVAKVTEMKVADADVTYLDIQGIYLYKARPFDPDAKAEKKANYRMLAVQFQRPKSVYHIRLVGPAKTVDEQRKGFDDWLKSFK